MLLELLELLESAKWGWAFPKEPLLSDCVPHVVHTQQKRTKIGNINFPQTWVDTSKKITSNWRRRKQDWKVWAFSYILTAYDYLPFHQSSDLNDRSPTALEKEYASRKSEHSPVIMVHRNHSFFSLILPKIWVRVKAPCLYCDVLSRAVQWALLATWSYTIRARLIYNCLNPDWANRSQIFL